MIINEEKNLKHKCWLLLGFCSGLRVNEIAKLKIEDLLNLQAKYILYIKKEDGSFDKKGTDLETHTCNYADFYNQFDKQVDYLGLSSRFKCLGEKKDTVQGFFADQIFSYFEISLSAKNDSILNTTEQFLFNNDCKFNIIFTDIIIDLDDYKTPITQFLNDDLFIQLNPTLFIKRNVYFMNQYFSNDDYWLFVFGDDEKEIKTLYSRYEEYALYMGLDRIINKPYNYINFAKIYFRADLKRTIIQRKYQKLMEFYADASSILIALYEVLYLFFNFIDYFYAYHSLAQHIFFFKGIEGNKNYNIFKKSKQIQELISLIESNENKNINYPEDNLKISRNKNKEENEKIVNNIELNPNKTEKTIQVYKNKKNKIENKNRNNFTILKKPKINSDKISYNNLYEPKQKIDDKNNYNIKESDLNSEDNLDGIKLSQFEKNLKNILSKNYNDQMMEHKDNFPTLFDIKMNTNSKIKNTFNIFEILISQIFKCCMTQNMKIKNFGMLKDLFAS